MKISSQRLKEIIQEEIYNLEVAEAVDLKDLADNEMEKVNTNLKTLKPLLDKIVDLVDKASEDAAKKVGETTDDITSKTEDRFDIIQSECLGKYCR